MIFSIGLFSYSTNGMRVRSHTPKLRSPLWLPTVDEKLMESIQNSITSPLIKLQPTAHLLACEKRLYVLGVPRDPGGKPGASQHIDTPLEAGSFREHSYISHQ